MRAFELLLGYIGNLPLGGSRGLKSRTRNPKVASSSLDPAEIVGGGSECTALSILRLRCP